MTDMTTEILMLTDWEKDIYTRVFLKVDNRATIKYTFNSQEAKDEQFKQFLKGAVSTEIKRTQVKSKVNHLLPDN
jgi:hypothetical protein